MAKFRDSKDSEEPIRESPPTSFTQINIVWVEYFYVRIFTKEPPARYPTALTKNMYENDVYYFPVASAKYGMIGPIPVMILPYSTNEYA